MLAYKYIEILPLLVWNSIGEKHILQLHSTDNRFLKAEALDCEISIAETNSEDSYYIRVMSRVGWYG
jgi:hypothetical protein